MIGVAVGLAVGEGTIGAHGGGYGVDGRRGYQFSDHHPFGPYHSGYQYGIGYGNQGFGTVMQYVYSHIGFNPRYEYD